MGLFTFAPPKALIRSLAEAFDLDTMIETGTYSGDTAAWAADLFARVVTIEISQKLRDAAAARHARHANIDFRIGDSAVALREVLPSLTRPALFWLDAHWSGGPTGGEDGECPLLDEIALIDATPHRHFLLIDDARLFCAPPPYPHRREKWPSIFEVHDALLRGDPGRYIVVYQDIIVAVPAEAKPLVADFCQNNPVRLKNLGDVRLGFKIASQGLAVKLGLREAP